MARTAGLIDGDVYLYLNQDIRIGTFDWHGNVLSVYPGRPRGRFIVDNAGQPSVWQMELTGWLWLHADLVLSNDLTLLITNATGFSDRVLGAQLGSIVTGRGRLVLDCRTPKLNTFLLGITHSARNSHTGGTRLASQPSAEVYFEPMKQGFFGIGDVELGPFAKLVLRNRFPTNDYIADSAGLWLETSLATNCAHIILDPGVTERVARLYIDGVQMPAGVYGATGSGATEVFDDFFSGSGVLVVTNGPPSPGSIQNLPAAAVSPPYAVISGELLATNASPTAVYVYWGPADGGVHREAWAREAYLGHRGLGTFYSLISDYSPGQTIYYRSYLTNVLGGKWACTTAKLCLPSVRNELPVVQTNYVTLRGSVLSTGGPPTTLTVFWGRTDAGTNATSWENAADLGVTSGGLLATNVTGLLPDTVYHYRVRGANIAGVSWANTSGTFKTVTGAPWGDITFVVASDLHYGATWHVPTADEICRLTIQNMNLLAGQLYPAAVGGGFVAPPRGALLAGDLTESATADQWRAFTNDWGLRGERLLLFPVYEGYGNHDTCSGDFAVVPQGIKERNLRRPSLRHISANGYHYSWDWDFLHVVCLNIFPGNELDPGFIYHEPSNSLQFLEEDLAKYVGTSGRPVVIYHHYGVDPSSSGSWSERQRKNYYEVIKNYNVICIFAGHSHGVGVFTWHGFTTCNVGTAGKYAGNFIVARVTRTNLTLVERTTTNTWRFWHRRTISVPPKVAVSNGDGATQVTRFSAQLNGQFLMNNPLPVLGYIFWGRTDGGTNQATWENAIRLGALQLGTFSTMVTGLDEGITYYYRCYVSNELDQAWAPSSVRFKTLTAFDNWRARMRITFTGYSDAEPLANFPALIVLGTNLQGFSYSQFASAAGYDLRFSDEAGVELNYEIDQWNTNGNSHVWVQLPRLAGTNTSVWAYWANPLAAGLPPAYTTNGATWSEGYAGVWHLNQPDALNSINGSVGQAFGNTNCAGVIGIAQGFSRTASNQFINVGQLNLTDFTLEAWTRTSFDTMYGRRRLIEKQGAFAWEQSSSSSNLNLLIQTGQDNLWFGQDGCDDAGPSAWTYQAITYDSSIAQADGYIDAVRKYSQTMDMVARPAFNTNPLTISSPSTGYYGLLDEVRISSVVRSGAWLKACYDTVANHNSFASYGPVFVNTPPVFAPVPDQIVEAGETLIVTNIATDAESPPQTLTFSLLSGPQGSHIESETGIFTWRPKTANISSTNLVTIRVFDNGLPVLSATQSFAIVVVPPTRPLFENPHLTGGGFKLEVWAGLPDRYVLEASTNLQDWTALFETNGPLAPLNWFEADITNFPTRFYRVRCVP